MKLLIGIPAYNEAEVITGVLKSLPTKISGIENIDILVIDDGSSDNTAKQIKEKSIFIIRHLTNRGLGGAIKTILLFAKLNKYDFVVTFDADGQHKGSDIEKLVKLQRENSVDIVIGSRWKNKSQAPLSRKLVNKAANIATSLFYGVYTTDSQSGLRLFNRCAIDAIELKSDRMEVSSEIFGEIAKHHLKFVEMPIDGIYTNYSLSKGQKISNSLDVLFKLVLRFLQ